MLSKYLLSIFSIFSNPFIVWKNGNLQLGCFSFCVSVYAGSSPYILMWTLMLQAFSLLLLFWSLLSQVYSFLLRRPDFCWKAFSPVGVWIWLQILEHIPWLECQIMSLSVLRTSAAVLIITMTCWTSLESWSVDEFYLAWPIGSGNKVVICGKLW